MQIKESLKFKDCYLYFVIFIICFIYFYFTFAVKNLNPLEVGWLWKNTDPVQQYLGWSFFRREPWHWPPGLTTTFNIAQPMSVGLTDSLPLLAFLFKPFSFILPDDFQYFGFYIFINLFLQGIFGILLSKRYTKNPILQVLFSIFFILSPPLLLRLNLHAALASHWLILAAIYDYPRAWNFKFWLVLTALSALIHPYLMVMVFALFFFKMIFNDYLNIKIRFLHFILCSFVALFLSYLSGQFVNSGSIYASGFGDYPTNLLSFFDSNFISINSLTPTIFFGRNPFGRTTQYLGFGVILLLLLVLFLKFLKKNKKIIIFDNKNKGLLSCVLLMAFFSLATPIYFANTPIIEIPIYDLPLLRHFAHMFRASGRFAWPLFYVVNIFVLAFLLKHFHPKICIFIFSVALVLQIIDLSPKYQVINGWHQKTNQNILWPHFPKEWEQYSKENADVVFISFSIALPTSEPNVYGVVWPYYLERIVNPSYFAYKHQMHGNYNFSRWNANQARAFMFKHWERLKAGFPPPPNTLYVFLEDINTDFLKKELPADIYSKLLFQNGYHLLPIQTEIKK